MFLPGQLSKLLIPEVLIAVFKLSLTGDLGSKNMSINYQILKNIGNCLVNNAIRDDFVHFQIYV